MAQKSSPKKPAKKAAAKKASVKPPKKSELTRKAAAPAPAPAKSKIDVKAAKKSSGTSIAKPSPSSEPAKEAKKEKVQPLSKSDLQYYRNLLLEKRQEILGDVGSMESEAFKGDSNLSNMPIHMADVGTDNFEQEFTLGLIESERQRLREIQEALVRIDSGTYGICQGTGKQIPKVRLEAVPWAKYTIEYSRLLESGQLKREEDAEEESSSGGSDDDED
ncbi:MAG TPA: TraR/DksA C4-type zinc finger protein [Phycisphaerae bacterium]